MQQHLGALPPLKGRIKTWQFKFYMRDTELLFLLYSPELRYDKLIKDVSVNTRAIAENVVAVMLAYRGRDLIYFKHDKDP